MKTGTDSVGAAIPVAVQAELAAVVTALWFDIDHAGGVHAAQFFTRDATLTFSRRTFRGTAEIDGVYRDRAARGLRVSRHLMSNLHVVDARTDRVDAVSALVLYAQDGSSPIPTTTPVLIADVVDRFVPAGESLGGGWLIASRRIDNHFLLPGDVLAVPTQ